jgi:predicted transport protein
MITTPGPEFVKNNDQSGARSGDHTHALDPCVIEEFLKLYVAFKAETNFADVIPQASRLLVSINMPFHDLNDPRGIARDVTNLGRWGNGDSEVVLDSADSVPYVIGLVRQALERQMGNGPADELT